MVSGCASAPPRLPFTPHACAWTRRYPGPWVFLAQDSLTAFFDVGDVAAYRQLVPAGFGMPPRPVLRLSVIDFHTMENAPPYFEAVVAILVQHDAVPGFYVVTMPVTDGDSCAGGRSAWGYPKIVRRVTLESSGHTALGTLYAEDAVTPEFTLAFAPGGSPSPEVASFLRLVSPMPNLSRQAGRVRAFGGFSNPIYDLERVNPATWRVALGDATVTFPNVPGNLLAQVGAGRTIAAYRLQQRLRYSIAPRA
jgi:hypothetical protein